MRVTLFFKTGLKPGFTSPDNPGLSVSLSLLPLSTPDAVEIKYLILLRSDRTNFIAPIDRFTFMYLCSSFLVTGRTLLRAFSLSLSKRFRSLYRTYQSLCRSSKFWCWDEEIRNMSVCWYSYIEKIAKLTFRRRSGTVQERPTKITSLGFFLSSKNSSNPKTGRVI